MPQVKKEVEDVKPDVNALNAQMNGDNNVANDDRILWLYEVSLNYCCMLRICFVRVVMVGGDSILVLNVTYKQDSMEDFLW